MTVGKAPTLPIGGLAGYKALGSIGTNYYFSHLWTSRFTFLLFRG